MAILRQPEEGERAVQAEAPAKGRAGWARVAAEGGKEAAQQVCESGAGEAEASSGAGQLAHRRDFWSLHGHRGSRGSSEEKRHEEGTILRQHI